MDPSVAEITITPQLWVRQTRPPDMAAETAAMRRLADTMATDAGNIYQTCVELALKLCRADTCGISLLERTEAGDEIFRWVALTGRLKEHLHGTTPRFFSPCGICVDTSTPLLMQRPELFYKYLDVGPPFHDVLLIPLTDKVSQIEGTIWIVAHDPGRKFDLENARMMKRIAAFIATALSLVNPGPKAASEMLEPQSSTRELDRRVNDTLAESGLIDGWRIMFPVEIQVLDDVAPFGRMAQMREWLDHRGFQPATFRYSAGATGFILRVAFAFEPEAQAFAAKFGGSLIATSAAGMQGRPPT